MVTAHDDRAAGPASAGPFAANGRASGKPLAVLGALFLATLALRPQLVGIGPLIPAIQADLAITHAAAGLLGTIPVLCMGLFAPLGPWVAGRIGPRRAVAACLAGIVAFGLLRATVPGALPVILVTLGIGVAMGTAGAVLPIVVKLRAPLAPGQATGAYAAGIVAGSLIAAAVAVPLAGSFGGWRAALALLALGGVISLVAWLVLLPADTGTDRRSGRPPRLPWGSPTAWLLVVVFGLQSLLYYATISWLPSAYVERGWSEGEAAGLIALLHLIGLGAGIGVPFVADRLGTRRSQLLAVAIGALVGFVGLVTMPDAAYLWIGLLGVSLGAIFPLCLTLPVDVAESPSEVGAVAALMLLGGYLLAGLGPVVLGLLRDASGDYAVSLWLLVALAAILVIACLWLSPERLRRGVRAAPAEA